MASPLLEYANAVVRAIAPGGVTTVDGRLVETPGDVYLFRCFLKRQQYKGVSSGSVKQPLPSQLGGELMTGASGDQYYYRGFYLQSAVVTEGFDWRGNLSGVNWSNVVAASDVLRPGTRVEFGFGSQDTMTATVERNTGVYGGLGIDNILYAEIGGVELQLTGAEVLN